MRVPDISARAFIVHGALPLLALVCCCARVQAATAWDGSRTVPVHRLAIFDEDGQRIVPVGTTCAPLSQRQTCGSCHDYQTIAAGWHFNAASTDKADKSGRPGEPWVLMDPITGTQLPLSYRGQAGTWKPDQVGMDAWQFTKQFARSLPGGGVSEPADLFVPGARWNLSGPLEANCLACHNRSPAQDSSEWARQVGRENFRWAPTAAAGLGDVAGMASRLRESWSPERRVNPDDNVYAVPPSVKYQPSHFDNKQRVLFDVGRPKDSNCLACHSATHGEATRTSIDGDVHSRAGLSCVDCHRNGMDHRIVRGYEGEAKDRDTASATSTSCRGCHMGTDGSTAGRFGAQRPAHKGLPAVHLEKMSCTACHSGGAKAMGSGPELVRTSRAHRIGIHGRAIWDTELPAIVEPVFAPGHDGKITPHRAMWPAFWARVQGDTVTPMLPEAVQSAAGAALNPAQRIATVLKAFASDPEAPGKPVLVSAGKVFGLAADGSLVSAPAPAAQATEKGFWSYETAKGLVPFSPAPGENGKLSKESEARITASLIVLVNAGIVNPVVTTAGTRYRVNLINGEMISEVATGDPAPILGRMKEGKILPLIDDLELAVKVASITAGTAATLSEEQITAVLKALVVSDAKASFAYVANGSLYRLGNDGALVRGKHSAAQPTLWPLAHDVRPAQQALGATGCKECHAPGAAFFNAPVTPVGPLAAATVSQPMSVYAGLNGTYDQMFALTFTMRPLFKAFLFCVAAGLALILALVVIRTVLVTSVVACTCGERWFRPAMLTSIATMVLLALTGFIPFLTGNALSGYALLAHNAIAGLFASAIAVMAVVGLGVRGANAGQETCRWLLVAAGLGVILSAVVMMMPWQGTDGMHLLLNIHRSAAAVAVLAGMGMSYLKRQPQTA